MANPKQTAAELRRLIAEDPKSFLAYLAEIELAKREEYKRTAMERRAADRAAAQAATAKRRATDAQRKAAVYSFRAAPPNPPTQKWRH